MSAVLGLLQLLSWSEESTKFEKKLCEVYISVLVREPNAT